MSVLKSRWKIVAILSTAAFVLVVVSSTLLIKENRGVIVVAAIALVSVWMRLFSNNRVTRIEFLPTEEVRLFFHVKPFIKKELIKPRENLRAFFKDKQLSEVSRAKQLIIYEEGEEEKYVVSSELLIWDEEQLRQINNYLNPSGS